MRTSLARLMFGWLDAWDDYEHANHERNPHRYCPICHRRLWWFQPSVVVYSLGDNRAHQTCAGSYIADKVRAFAETMEADQRRSRG